MAVGRGPVAVAFSVTVGSNLLSNMILQLALGMAHYTKNMVTGTLVLSSAVMMLPDVGPSEVPVDFGAYDVLGRPAAVIYVACSFVIVGVGLRIILRGTVQDNNTALLFAFAMVNGSATVLSTSISKLVQMHLSLQVRIPVLIVYVLLGCFCLCMAAIANATLQDPSVFVPVGAGVNLVLTFVSGLCIWADWSRLEHHLCYIMAYTLVVLGTYSVSSFDLNSKQTGQIEANRYVAATEKNVPTYDCEYEPRRSLRQCFQELLLLWSQGSAHPGELRTALVETLRLGLDRELISHRAIAELFVSLAEEPSLCPAASFRSEALEVWLRQALGTRLDRVVSFDSGDSLEAALLHGASPVG